MIWFVESYIIFSIDDKISSINVIAFKHHIKYFWLVNGTLFHKVNYLILYKDLMVYIVVQLNLDFIFELSSFGK